MVLIIMFFGYGGLLNLEYNFWYDARNEASWYLRILWPSILMLILQVGSVAYAISMLTWYAGMATRNMHAVEETASGATYNKALYWGIIKDDDIRI
jgi:hypothetical protein